jgi:hypothetical protein
MSGRIWLPSSAQGPSTPTGKPPPWIAFNQLEWVKETILGIGPDAHFMEWGAGGSSIWFTENLPDTIERTVIESDHDWADRVRGYGTKVCTPTEESWTRNQHGFDCSCSSPDYICRPEVATADVILVDGFNRGHCLAWISHMARAGTIVFLHDNSFHQLQWAFFLPCWGDRQQKESDKSNNPSPMGRVTLK